jgi:hypothetical protein
MSPELLKDLARQNTREIGRLTATTSVPPPAPASTSTRKPRARGWLRARPAAAGSR